MNDEAQSVANKLSARRRLLRGGLGVSPVLLALASRPVLAATCKTASATASGNTSRPNTLTPCNGIGPAAWVGSSSWPNGIDKPTALLSAHLPAITIYQTNATLLAVLDGTANTQGSPSDQLKLFAQAIVAAYLNNVSVKTSDTMISQAQLKSLWTEATTLPGFEAASGVRWNAEQATAWLTASFNP